MQEQKNSKVGKRNVWKKIKQSSWSSLELMNISSQTQIIASVLKSKVVLELKQMWGYKRLFYSNTLNKLKIFQSNGLWQQPMMGRTKMPQGLTWDKTGTMRQASLFEEQFAADVRYPVHRRERTFSRDGITICFRTFCQRKLKESGNYVVLNTLEKEENSSKT